MNSSNSVKLEEPVIEHLGALSLAGMRQHIDERFDPRTGMGEVDILVPVQA